MNKKKLILLTSLLTVAVMAFVLSLTSLGVAKVNNAKSLKLKLQKPDVIDLVFVAVNNWNYVMRNNGSYMYDSPDADGNHNNAGGEFPRGSGITIVYAGGLYIGTLKNGVPVVSETEFATEFQPGFITNSGVAFADLTADNPLSEVNQVYYIDRSLSGDDYINWPAAAPRTALNQPAVIADGQTWAVFNDLDITLNQESNTESPDPGLGMQVSIESFAFNAGPLSDVVYVKLTIENKTNTDYPDSYLGAWMDADVGGDSGNDIVGVDTVRGLGFVYNNTSEAPNDKATGFDFFQGPVVDITDVSASLAAKFAGNDTVLVYNPSREVYEPTLLPAGKIWLGATAFNTYANGTDPIDNNERYNLLAGRDKSSGIPKSGCGLEDYYAFRGNPITGQGTCDVAGSANPRGGLFATAADQRILHGVGPFTIKAGASQEIWLGIVGAGGASRLAAVSNMFATDDIAQITFNAGLVAPKPPAVPKMQVSAMDGAVSIIWSNNAEIEGDNAGEILGINTSNGYSANYLKYDFQGYRVWKSFTGLPGSFRLLAEYDKVDGITTVNNMTLNSLGHLKIEDIVVGTDNGLAYNYMDYDVTNQTRYYYSVTAYDAQPYISYTFNFTDPENGITVPNPTGLPITLQTAPTANVTSIVPMAAYLGTKHDASLVSDTNGTVVVTHNGPSDGSLDVSIVDPTRVQDGTYKVDFFTIPSDSQGAVLRGGAYLPSNRLVYQVILNNTDVRTIASRSDDPRTYYDVNNNDTFNVGIDIKLDDSKFGVNQASATDASTEVPIIVDGIRIVVFGPSLDVKQMLTVANATGPLAKADMGCFAFNSSGFPTLDFQPAGGAVTFVAPDDGVNDRPNIPNLLAVPGAASAANGGKWGIHAGGTGTNLSYGPATTTTSFLYRVFRGPNLTNFARFVPYDWEIRFKTGGNWGWMAFSTGNIVNVPFEAWRIGIGTYADTTDDVQCIPAINDADGNDLYNLLQATHPISGGSNDPYTDWIYFYVPDGASPGRQGFNDFLFGSGTASEVMARLVLVNWNGGSITAANWPANVNQTMPAAGTVFRINSTKPNQATDEFTFAANGNSVVTAKKELKKGLKDVKVVPNPYYGRSTYQASLFDKQIKFTNLPAECTIKIFTVSGDLVASLTHNDMSENNRLNTNPLDLFNAPSAQSTGTEVWNVQNTNGKYVASGMYIALIDAKGIGKKLVKFAVIQEEMAINGPDVR